MKKEPKRAVLLAGPDKELPITRATKINTKDGARQFIHLDQLKDGTWRLVWTSGLVDEWSEVRALIMIREDDDDDSPSLAKGYCDHPEGRWINEAQTTWNCPVCGERKSNYSWEICGRCQRPRVWHYRLSKNATVAPWDTTKKCSIDEFQPTGQQWPHKPKLPSIAQR